ncbi:endo-1,4-beta-xylanase [Mucisphaera calidilacus]|uniref:Beta-xylanase n=1 Tax=Mucisphaera calidilacus TaxID=2527982 RepID=A0A518BYI5_9BACT|nr:endo-1,4-beta-xylanase [Mucisphaera calidilacus]QDU72039.1 Endo-1,4-beta-xylanase Z precursor [Mucisphaera calidilacus]
MLYHGHVRSALAIACLTATTAVAGAAEITLSDFNNAGFDYTFDNFTQTLGPDVLRLTDTSDGWGGGGMNDAYDLSAFAEARIVVDAIANPDNRVDTFTIELIDTHGNSGKWDFATTDLLPTGSTRLVARKTLENPESGINDYQSLDLANITKWQLLGQWNSPSPVDLSFDNVIISTDAPPPPAYPGAEPDAPWRAEAAARIEQHRKAGLSLIVTAGNAAPASDVTVRVDMTRHDFTWGTAAAAWRIEENNAASQTYKDKLHENFNAVTLENALKWPPLEGEWGHRFDKQTSAAALDWLSDNSFDVRGHVQVWPGYDNLPGSVRTKIDAFNSTASATVRDQLRAEIQTLIEDHITELALHTDGTITWWDMVNETRANRDLIEIFGESEVAHWFNLGRQANPDTPLFLNDYGILSSGGSTNSNNQQFYEDQIQRIIDDGGAIDGIGFQAHFDENSITGPAAINTILDRYAAFGLDLHITEFDLDTTDEELQAQYTRDFLTIIFAHPDVDAFTMWGLWEDAHWKPDAAMYRNDWSIKPNGIAYQDLVLNQWWTDEQTSTDAEGQAAARVFLGTHTITLEHRGITQTYLGVNIDDDTSLDLQLADGYDGTIHADVTNTSGRLHVAGDGIIGRLSLAGSYTQIDDATLVLDLEPTGRDTLFADTIHLGGTLELRVAFGYTPAPGTPLPIFFANQYTGAFDDVFADRLVVETYTAGQLFGVNVLAILGDFNLDQQLTADDVDILLANLGNPAYDLTRDNTADHDDLHHLITFLMQGTPGDANLDHTVDLLDLSILAANFDTAGNWTAGDFNNDNSINLLDLSILAANFGRSTIPEPGTLTALLLSTTLCRRRR